MCVPNVFHAEVACDALAHGKHVICEKPIAHTWEAARDMAAAAAEAKRVAQVCFYYRTWPAIAWARQLVDSGELGAVRNFRGWMLQDYAANPAHDLGWRARLAESGAGRARRPRLAHHRHRPLPLRRDHRRLRRRRASSSIVTSRRRASTTS